LGLASLVLQLAEKSVDYLLCQKYSTREIFAAQTIFVDVAPTPQMPLF